MAGSFGPQVRADGDEEPGDQPCVIFNARDDPMPTCIEDFMEEMARNHAGLPDDLVDAEAAIRGRLGLPDPLACAYGDPVPNWGFTQAWGNLCREVNEAIRDRLLTPWSGLDWRDRAIRPAAGMVT